jgi:hypothetical protein
MKDAEVIQHEMMGVSLLKGEEPSLKMMGVVHEPVPTSSLHLRNEL